MQYTDTFQIGATNIIIPTGMSNIVSVIPARSVNGGFFRIAANSSAGTLAIVQNTGSSYISGYVIGAAEVISWTGPARFFLAASGATMLVSYCPSYNDGFSLTP